jgi:hypothetical protein
MKEDKSLSETTDIDEMLSQARLASVTKQLKDRWEELQKERRAKVLELVSKAMLKQDAATYHGDTRGMAKVGNETTDEIMKIFS